MKKFKIKSFCKVNLSLRIINKLKNHYHNISSFITFADLHDVISVEKIRGLKDIISFSGRFKKGINKRSNTITKVLYLLRKKKFFKKIYFRINIQKNIPHGSGLGGGSSNAANLLNFFSQKAFLSLSNKEIEKIATQIGFDVPITLQRKNTFLTGKKGKILRLNNKFRLNLLIVYPNIICSTKKMYEKNNNFSSPKYSSKINRMNKKQLINFLKKEKNDLETTIIKFYPIVGKIIDIMKVQNGCYFSRITGSGSACVGIFSNMKTAIYTKKLIKLKFPKYWSATSKTI